jgi:AmiR/NasT family two-component response regulator
VTSLSFQAIAAGASEGSDGRCSGGNGAVSAETWARLQALELENEQLRTALERLIVIEQAKGAISVRCNVPTDVALEMLRGLARSQERELHGFAAEVVANYGRLSGGQ